MPIKTHKLRRREEYAENASKLHKAIGELLGQSIFKQMTVFQEYPVEMINPDCPNSRMKVDWYIKTLHVAVEAQGQHHYNAVQYGGQAEEQANKNFIKQVHRDIDKAQYLEAVGCPVIEVHYNQALSLDWLIERITNAANKIRPADTNDKLQQPKVKTEWQKEAAEKRRAYQREQYLIAKERRKR